MGDKRVSKRTLDSGETVMHSPDGTQVLVQETDTLADKLDGQLEDNQQRHEAIKQGHVDAIALKRERQRKGGLPPEKSPV